MSKYDSDPDFNLWWEAYPLKKGKSTAFKAWQKADRLPIDQMLSILHEQITKERQWKNKQFIPHPSTYLNQERWEDEITIQQTTQIETPVERNIAATRTYFERIRGAIVEPNECIVRQTVGNQLRLGW